jgi:hypothetical protein
MREETKAFLRDLEKQKPGLFTMLLAGFRNIHDDTFFDKSRLR